MSNPTAAALAHAFTLRDLDRGNVSERNHVFRAWLKSYSADPRCWWNRAGFNGLLATHGHNRAIDRLFSLPDVSIRVLQPVDVPGSVVGWSCTQGDVLHYVYVKNRFRREGLATRLLAGLRLSRRSHGTTDWESFRFAPLTYDPYLFLSPEVR